MDKRSRKPVKKNKSMMNLSRLIRLLILIFMILIMVFLFLIARTIYLGSQEQEQEIAELPSDTEAPITSASTGPGETSTEKESERSSAVQPVEVSELEVGETLYDDPEPSSAEPVNDNDLSSGRILIGDSRFAYWSLQHIALDPGDILIAKGGEYFGWFRDTAVPELTRILDMNPNYDVIINMGLNDCANNIRGGTLYFTPDYINIINDLYVRYPTTAFYFASIGPIRANGIYPSVYGNIKAEDLQLYIDIFNYAMRTQCMAEYIELGEYLYDGNPTFVDNVHYDAATDSVIYAFIKEHVRKSVYDPKDE